MVKSGKQARRSGTLADSPSHLMHRALQLALDIYSEEAGEGGPTQRQFAVMEAVSVKEGLTQTELVRATGIDRSTLADLVARMTTKGLLSRERSSLDARGSRPPTNGSCDFCPRPSATASSTCSPISPPRPTPLRTSRRPRPRR
jgi:hypothetical protein